MKHVRDRKSYLDWWLVNENRYVLYLKIFTIPNINDFSRFVDRQSYYSDGLQSDYKILRNFFQFFSNFGI